MHGDDLFKTPLDQPQIDFDNEGGETYICGNPPYLGSKRQGKEQKSDLNHVFCGYTTAWRPLDYAAGWFMKAAEYGKHATSATAFVATNSICQGQQVSILWPAIAKTGHEIHFAHTSLKWTNLASNNAGVTVIIVGISRASKNKKRLFSLDKCKRKIERKVDNINFYLVPGKDIFVERLSRHITGLPELYRGNSPTDGGNLLLDTAALDALRLDSDDKAKLIRRFVGSMELIRGLKRYCIWIEDHEIETAESIPAIASRIEEVRKFRLTSRKSSTVAAANWPHRFDERKPIPQDPSICIPITSSERREYLLAGLLEPNVVVSNLCFSMPVQELWVLAIIVSRMNLVWVSTVCSRMRTDYRFTNTLAWNTFAVPRLTEKNKMDLTDCANNILLARIIH